MAASRKRKIPVKSEAGELIKKLRKPLAPPTRVVPDENKYSRSRQRAMRRKDMEELK